MTDKSNPMASQPFFKDHAGNIKKLPPGKTVFVEVKERPLVYMWIVHYKDGKSLPQFDPETLEENSFPFENQDRFFKVGFYPFSPDFAAKLLAVKKQTVIASQNKSHEVVLREGQRIIILRRPVIAYNITASGRKVAVNILDDKREIVYMLGYQETVKGVNRKSIMFIREDGRVQLSDDFETGDVYQ